MHTVVFSILPFLSWIIKCLSSLCNWLCLSHSEYFEAVCDLFGLWMHWKKNLKIHPYDICETVTRINPCPVCQQLWSESQQFAPSQGLLWNAVQMAQAFCLLTCTARWVTHVPYSTITCVLLSSTLCCKGSRAFCARYAHCYNTVTLDFFRFVCSYFEKQFPLFTFKDVHCWTFKPY